MSKKSLIAGTLILTLASFITRLLGFGFRIYQSQVMGASGMGLYQLLFPIYMLLWAASSAGIAMAIAKMVAGEVSKGNESNATHILHVSIFISLPISIVLSILLYLFAPFISIYYIQEPVTELSLRILALCVPFMSTACCLRGYFQGHQEMSITALAQIVEQLGRMITIYLLAGLLVPQGIKYICALGVIGMCAGEFFSFIMSYIAYRIKKRSLKLNAVSLKTSDTFKKLLNLSVPVTANRFLTSGLQSFQNILIPITLGQFGLSSNSALGLYGKFSGMALPLLMFPSMVTSSLATALVPAISEAVAMKNTTLLKNTMSKAIQFSSLIGIGSTTLFLTLPDEIAIACYKLPEVGQLLKWLAIICPFLYLQNILTGAMNGLGMQKKTFITNIMGSCLCIIVILTLVPNRGIIGFVLAMLLQSGFVCTMLLSYVLKFIDLPVDIRNWIVMPSIAAFMCSFVTITINKTYLIHNFTPTLATTLSVCLLGGSYIIILFLIGAIKINDLKNIRL